MSEIERLRAALAEAERERDEAITERREAERDCESAWRARDDETENAKRAEARLAELESEPERLRSHE